MTSDFIQNNQATGLDLTRPQSFLDGTHDLFGALARHVQGRESPDPHIEKTITLLKRAQKTIESAEKKIQAQHKRIQDLEELITVDELTKLSNIAGLHETLKRESARMKREEAQETLLVLVDLDNAEAIQKQNGADAHRGALKLIAQILSNEARAMDIAARTGESEFMLMFPNTHVDKTLARAQQLAKRLSRLSMVWGEHEIDISVSVSLKSFGPNDTADSILPSQTQGIKPM